MPDIWMDVLLSRNWGKLRIVNLNFNNINDDNLDIISKIDTSKLV